MKKIWLIGASQGIGEELTKLLVREGNFVILSARNKEKLQALEKEIGNNVKALDLDVTGKKSIEEAYKKVIKEEKIDTLIYAAGDYTPMSAKKIDLEKSERIIDINLTGALRVLNFVIPDFLKQKQGHIVLIGSIAGYGGLPNSLAYGASKAGLIHLAECLKNDLYEENIKIQVINPGFVRTRLTDKNAFDMPAIITADKAAKHIAKIMKGNKFEARFPFLFPGIVRIVSRLPYFLYFKLMQLVRPKEN